MLSWLMRQTEDKKPQMTDASKLASDVESDCDIGAGGGIPKSVHAQKYRELAAELNELAIRIQGDSEKADSIRDKMDYYWYRIHADQYPKMEPK